MNLSLVKRRELWWPTPLGWMLVLFVIATPLVSWFLAGEKFLSPTLREPEADVLIVEGWIAGPGIRAAMTEYNEGGYRHLVTTGGPTGLKGKMGDGAGKAETLRS